MSVCPSAIKQVVTHKSGLLKPTRLALYGSLAYTTTSHVTSSPLSDILTVINNRSTRAMKYLVQFRIQMQLILIASTKDDVDVCVILIFMRGLHFLFPYNIQRRPLSGENKRVCSIVHDVILTSNVRQVNIVRRASIVRKSRFNWVEYRWANRND